MSGAPLAHGHQVAPIVTAVAVQIAEPRGVLRALSRRHLGAEKSAQIVYGHVRQVVQNPGLVGADIEIVN